MDGKNIVLSYVSCNFVALLAFCLVSLLMAVTLFLLKLYADAQLYRRNNSCLPISYYLGEMDGCRTLLDETTKSEYDLATADMTPNYLLLLHQMYL